MNPPLNVAQLLGTYSLGFIPHIGYQTDKIILNPQFTPKRNCKFYSNSNVLVKVSSLNLTTMSHSFFCADGILLKCFLSSPDHIFLKQIYIQDSWHLVKYASHFKLRLKLHPNQTNDYLTSPHLLIVRFFKKFFIHILFFIVFLKFFFCPAADDIDLWKNQLRVKTFQLTSATM